ncbi:phage baseplate assembly protein V [Nostoc sp. FACHB-110]|uniref:phage baseplate assembly protein V n=1 Tax=Nostoc sp. FACHB-110 TaxID=2692834 RepID=UPI0016827A66|nr:phage baseplate assembly protein V [Nostoc sp. FACHB-110]MBD2438756.1 phage tail protein [Nostoc sp. FACHB-110]
MNGLDLLINNHNQDNTRLYGVTVGIVTNNQDPKKEGRVKLKFPYLSNAEESSWSRVLTPMAGNDRGIYFLPEVDDEVLVAFEHGDIHFPYILGALWNGQDKPPGKNDDGKNNQRIIKSRSGHQIILDDTDGEEQIIIQDKTGKNKIVFNSKENNMNIQVEKDLTIATKGKIILKSSDNDISLECKNLQIKTQENYQLTAGKNCIIQANQKYELEAKSGLEIKCAAGVKVNDGALEVM